MENEMLKEKIKETYGNIAQSGNSGCCTSDGCCAVPDFSPKQTSFEVGYDNKTLESIPESSILGLGCGIPVDFANLIEGETVVDLGSGAGIDVFLASKKVQKNGKIIGIDFTDKMLDKARNAAQENGFSNVEFRKGDIEERIPVEDSTVDVAISNCVINLATDKVKAFKEIYRILKKGGQGRMVISDLVTNEEVQSDSVNAEKWCGCIDGALTRENYIQSIKDAGFKNVEILNEKPYLDEGIPTGREITSLTIKALTG
jgi:SAM-dependent methyltransferase